MPSDSSLVAMLIGVGGAFAGWVGYTVRSTLRRRRAEKRIDGGLGSFREGEEATVVGTVRAAGEPLIAPLSGKSCVAYDARARVGVINFSTQPEIVKVEVVPFELHTATGVVRIEADHADLLFPRVPLIPRKVERESAFVRAHGITGPMADVDCDEVCVEVGREVAVHGVLSIDLAVPGGEVGYRDGGTRLKLGPHPEHHLTIGDPR
jgi:hypothetical protein